MILKSDWWKGHYRKGLAQLKLNLLDEAMKTIKEALELDKENQTLKGV